MIDKTTRVKIKVVLIFCIILDAMLLSSCAYLKSLLSEANIKKPIVRFTKAKLSRLSFDAADFLFDINIKNPNSMGFKLAGFDYNFLVNGSSFLKGKQDNELEIAAKGENTIQLPLSLNFEDIYRTFRSIYKKDRSTYQLKCGFSFKLPVLGQVRIPLSKKGDFPLLKLPSIELDAFKLKKLNFTSADMELGVKVKNPNPFSMILNNLTYQLKVNGNRWVSGNAKKKTEVSEKGESIIKIPISLNFLEVGKSVYKILAESKSVKYNFLGNFALASSLPLLGKVKLPFDTSGKIKIIE